MLSIALVCILLCLVWKQPETLGAVGLFLLLYFGVISLEGVALATIVMMVVAAYVLGVCFICKQVRKLETARTRWLTATVCLVISMSGPTAATAAIGCQIIEYARWSGEMAGRLEAQQQVLQEQHEALQLKAAEAMKVTAEFNRTMAEIVSDIERERGPLSEELDAAFERK